jgi:transcription antitermination factor NusA-like protein
MKICAMCRKSDVLCQSCLKAVEEGKISELDVKVGRGISSVDDKADYIEALDGKKVIIIVEADMAKRIIGKGGRGVRAIEEAVGKKVKILDKTEDKKKIAEDMLRVPVIGLNVLYGTEEKIRVRVETIYKRRVSQDSISSLAKLYGKDVNIVYE